VNRRISILVIALASMALCVVVTPVAKASPPCYTVSGTTITGYGTCSGAVVIEPGITEIGEAAFRRSGVTSIDIPASVTTIAAFAFYELDSLTAVTFHEGLIRIEECAFAETSLTSIVIPNSVTYIGQSGFYGIREATNLVIGTGLTEITSDVFVAIGATTITVPPNVKSIGARAFLEAESLETIILSEGLEIIEEDAFTLTISLVNINIPSTVYSIATTSTYVETSIYSPEILTRVAATSVARGIRIEAERKAAIYERARLALENRTAARNRILNALISGKAPTSNDLLVADFKGITSANVSSLQVEIESAKATTLEEIEKLALKVSLVSKLSGTSSSILTIAKKDLAAIGIVGMDGAYKSTILRSIALANASDRDTYDEVQALAKKYLAQAEAKRLRLISVIERNQARK
jgi:hypothetical protein